MNQYRVLFITITLTLAATPALAQIGRCGNDEMYRTIDDTHQITQLVAEQKLDYLFQGYSFGRLLTKDQEEIIRELRVPQTGVRDMELKMKLLVVREVEETIDKDPHLVRLRSYPLWQLTWATLDQVRMVTRKPDSGERDADIELLVDGAFSARTAQ